MAETQLHAVVLDDAGPDRLGQRRGTPMAGRPEMRARSASENADPRIDAACSTCRASPGRKRAGARSSAAASAATSPRRPPPASQDLDGAFLLQRGQQFGDEQRVSRRPRDLGQKTRPGLGRHHFDTSSPTGPAPSGDRAGAGRQRPAGRAPRRPVPRRGELAASTDDPHREIGDAAAHRGQRHQAGGVRPLQVIGTDHDRPGQGQSLHQVTDASTTGTAARDRWSP